MKICFVQRGFSQNGGIERVVSILAEELAREYEVYLVTMEKWDRNLFFFSIPESVKGVGWDTKATMRKIIFDGGIRRLRNYLKKNDIDIVIACGTLYYPLVTAAVKGIRTKCICWEHSNANNGADHKFQMQARYVGARFSDAVVTLTKQDQNLYNNKYHPKRLRQIYNPVDPKLKPSGNDRVPKKKIISVGRISYQKNYPVLVEIANEILHKHDDWIWDIYGGGSHDIWKQIDESIQRNDLNGKLNLKGQISNLYDYYQEYDFLVMTSLYEGFSMALLEALANGLPLIVFDVECGPREVIDDGINGYLVQPFDKNGMICCIERLIENEKFLKEMRSKTEKKLGGFKMEEVISQWKLLFEELRYL